MKAILVVTLAAVFTGCATAPPAAAPGAPAAPAVAAAPANGAAPAATAQLSGDTRDLQKWARMQGYRQTNRPQGVLWCKQDIALGTHLPHTDCLKEETLAEMRRAYNDNRDEMLRATRGCNSNQFCGSQ